MKSIGEYNFSGKKVLVRVDFNVPVDKDFNITDSTRIEAVIPTLNKILRDGGSVILMSHLGRPKGSVDPSFSFTNIFSQIENILEKKMLFVRDAVGNAAVDQSSRLKPGEILLLENLRFYKGEEEGNVDFARKLASLGDSYVNDAFGTAHRAHASTSVIARFFPNSKFFGFLMEKELKAIDKVLLSGEKPVTAVLGGSKVSTKITIIKNILSKVDNLIIGGGMAFTFVKAKGGNVGDSVVENDKLDLALSVLNNAKSTGVKVFLPLDVIAADSFDNKANTEEVAVDKIPLGWQGLDVGMRSRQLFDKVIMDSKTILWNGPVGVFEMSAFSKGTFALGESIARATENGAYSLVGGGDSVAFVKQNGFENKVSYVSTGGGAMLESLEGIELPGVSAIIR
ncbi:MAG: phosphoglycerate kinase [Bergeyella sp.]|nr:phosphoglycerate kinase [Bergeyella sp.]